LCVDVEGHGTGHIGIASGGFEHAGTNRRACHRATSVRRPDPPGPNRCAHAKKGPLRGLRGTPSDAVQPRGSRAAADCPSAVQYTPTADCGLAATLSRPNT
jgi:hypothetical protein